MTTRAVFIPTDAPPEELELTNFDIPSAARGLIDAPSLDVVSCRGGGFVVYVDEFGSQSRPENRVATSLLSLHGRYAHIFGPVFIIGMNPDTGEDAQLSHGIVIDAQRIHANLQRWTTALQDTFQPVSPGETEGKSS